MELYKKIVINGPDDYPKSDGEYFCCRSGLMSVQKLLANPAHKSYMREIRWYLQPIEQPSAPVSAEDLINKIYDKIADDLKSARLERIITDDGDQYPLVDHLSGGDNTIKTGLSEINYIVEQIEIEDLLKEYASQLQRKPTDLREEIIKFLDFADPIYWGENVITDRRQLIDKYLESK